MKDVLCFLCFATTIATTTSACVTDTIPQQKRKPMEDRQQQPQSQQQESGAGDDDDDTYYDHSALGTFNGPQVPSLVPSRPLSGRSAVSDGNNPTNIS